jgi:hypothetical protein
MHYISLAMKRSTFDKSYFVENKAGCTIIVPRYPYGWFASCMLRTYVNNLRHEMPWTKVFLRLCPCRRNTQKVCLSASAQLVPISIGEGPCARIMQYLASTEVGNGILAVHAWTTMSGQTAHAGDLIILSTLRVEAPEPGVLRFPK